MWKWIASAQSDPEPVTSNIPAGDSRAATPRPLMGAMFQESSHLFLPEDKLVKGILNMTWSVLRLHSPTPQHIYCPLSAQASNTHSLQRWIQYVFPFTVNTARGLSVCDSGDGTRGHEHREKRSATELYIHLDPNWIRVVVCTCFRAQFSSHYST